MLPFVFFERKVPEYIHDIFDVNFLSGRVLLAKNNVLKTLENQTNKNFELIFLVNDRYLSEEKYGFIFTELKTEIILPIKFMNSGQFRQLVKETYSDYDFVIQSRIDYDDFVYKDAVADTQSKIEECENILSYGYSKGYAYFNGELYIFPLPNYFKNGQMSVFQSWICKSSFVKDLPYMSPYTFNHTKVKPMLKEFLEKNGVAFSENMYKNNVTTNAFIFFRHDSTWSNAGKPYLEIPAFIRRQRKLTSEDITKKQLAEEFGFVGYEFKSIKDEESEFNYDFKSTQAEELGFRQDLTAIKWIE